MELSSQFRMTVTFRPVCRQNFAFMGNGEIRQFIGDYSKYEAAAAESKAMLAGGAKTGTGKERIEAVKASLNKSR